MDVSELTPVAQDYLKVIWSATEWGGGPVTTKALAARHDTSAAAVTDTMKRLAAQGLINYQPYRPVSLTPLGERLAVEMVRRHRLLETFLAEHLGYGWDEVHDEAERLEHAVSATFVERIDRALGRPTTDPHGDPIPTSTGDLPDYRSQVLAQMPAGRYRISRVSDHDAEQLSQLAGAGLLPGRELELASASGANPSLQVRVGGDVVELSAAERELIWVIPVED
ncbi:metal-dependent transcriptional regulator [Naumannella halotolerans]|uniref:Manganese transport regulator n=1 Tax=Naumannella halotolerans TaxID=993414 RepID=A0A4R7J7Z7_9ACTN|nr:metal-dependent transcriptional regulator [Naumannella halotolerans]TDT33395.1 DtxR family Mn-dependent transcriptional regulator [Naumannella halotolerans]